MAITQDFDSQTSHKTRDGMTVHVVFSMTWTDWGNQGDDNWALPDIGGYLYDLIAGWEEFPDLQCVDIQTTALDNVNMKAIYLYSTENRGSRSTRADQVASWDFDYESTLELTVGDHYGEVAGNWPDEPSYAMKHWPTEWVKTYSGSADSIPELKRWSPRGMLRLNIYGSKFYNRTLQAFLEGVVNKEKLFGWILEQSNAQFPSYEQDPEFNDTGKWLCMEVQTKRMRNNCFNYQLLFKYTSIGWNYVLNGSGTRQALNRYHAYDFTLLLQDMNFALPDSNIARK